MVNITKIMNSKKETILKSFSNMDIAMLEIILDDSRTYQDATKETFLQKLHEVFIKFKSNNDESLIPYSGKCVSGECNKGCKGYSFVGNNSSNHTDFIFEETEQILRIFIIAVILKLITRKLNYVMTSHCMYWVMTKLISNLQSSIWQRFSYVKKLTAKL